MRRPSPLFQHVIFALLVVWFLLLAITFFINRPVTLISLLPELMLLALVIMAAYSVGSFIAFQLQLEEVLLPGEDFVISTSLGLGGLALLAVLAAMLGVLTWWTVGLGLILAIVTGFKRIIGLATPPAYLFGPEDMGEEAPSPITWLQYIVIAFWIIVFSHFCFLPPVFEGSLAGALGVPSQWALQTSIGRSSVYPAGSVSLPDGLFAMALALRGPHLAMFISGLVGGLAMGALYLNARRYCGPVASRSALLAAMTLPLFAFSVLAPSGTLVVALFQFCAFFCTIRWFDEDRRRWAVLGGIFIGLSLGSSATSLLFIPPLLIAALVWSVIRKRWKRFLLNMSISALAAAIALAPWLVITTIVFGSPLEWAEPLTSLHPPPLKEGFTNLLLLPLTISFPGASIPVWEVVGPIFLVFVPFFFITYRKNPNSGLAVAAGLAFLGFCEPFGLGLLPCLAALMLLAIPAAMAAHRFVETGWQKKTAIIMLYLMIGWQMFHSTVMIETVYPSPYRFLIGIESSEQFLERAVPYYPAARYINENLPADAHILTLGQSELLYIERVITISDTVIAGKLQSELSGGGEIEQVVSNLRAEGYSHLLINTRKNRPDAVQPVTGGKPVSNFSEAIKRLAHRRLYQSDGIVIFSLLPQQSS